jgi:hypothetical protein
MHIVCMGYVKMHTKSWSENINPKGDLEDLHTDLKTILNSTLNRVGGTDCTSVSYVHFVLDSDTTLFGTHLQDHMATYTRRHPKCSLSLKPHIWCHSSSSGNEPMVGLCEHCNNLQVPWKVENFSSSSGTISFFKKFFYMALLFVVRIVPTNTLLPSIYTDSIFVFTENLLHKLLQCIFVLKFRIRHKCLKKYNYACIIKKN